MMDLCKEFSTSQKCACRSTWSFCHDWLGADCEEFHGCSSFTHAGYAWCQVKENSCPKTAADFFGNPLQWDYCVDDNFNHTWPPRKLPDIGIGPSLPPLTSLIVMLLSAAISCYVGQFTCRTCGSRKLLLRPCMAEVGRRCERGWFRVRGGSRRKWRTFAWQLRVRCGRLMGRLRAMWWGCGNVVRAMPCDVQELSEAVGQLCSGSRVAGQPCTGACEAVGQWCLRCTSALRQFCQAIPQELQRSQQAMRHRLSDRLDRSAVSVMLGQPFLQGDDDGGDDGPRGGADGAAQSFLGIAAHNLSQSSLWVRASSELRGLVALHSVRQAAAALGPTITLVRSALAMAAAQLATAPAAVAQLSECISEIHQATVGACRRGAWEAAVAALPLAYSAQACLVELRDVIAMFSAFCCGGGGGGRMMSMRSRRRSRRRRTAEDAPPSDEKRRAVEEVVPSGGTRPAVPSPSMEEQAPAASPPPNGAAATGASAPAPAAGTVVTAAAEGPPPPAGCSTADADYSCLASAAPDNPVEEPTLVEPDSQSSHSDDESWTSDDFAIVSMVETDVLVPSAHFSTSVSAPTSSSASVAWEAGGAAPVQEVSQASPHPAPRPVSTAQAKLRFYNP